MTPTSPTSFIFHFPEGEKRSEDMTTEELLRVIEWQRREIERQSAQAKRDLDFISGCFKR